MEGREGTPRETGLTLVDTAIAAAVLLLVVGLAYPGFRVANDTISASGLRDRVERSGDRILRRITEELRPGQITALREAPDPPSVTLARPRAGVDLADIDTGGAVPWSGETRTIRFRQTGVITEADEREDLNRDGDREDEFALGLVEVLEGGTARPVTESGRVLLALPGFSGDVDGDGAPDPLFARDGRSVRVEVHVLTRSEEGRIVTTVVEGSVRLRNSQE